MNNIKENDTKDEVPQLVKDAVLVHSSPLPNGTPTVKGTLSCILNFFFINKNVYEKFQRYYILFIFFRI